MDLFFNTWKIGGKYASITAIDECSHCKTTWLSSFSEEERPRAIEAMQLYKEANDMLDKLEALGDVKIEAIFGVLLLILGKMQLSCTKEMSLLRFHACVSK